MSKKIEFEYKCFCCEKEIPSAGYCKACNDRLLDIELKSERIYSSENKQITAMNKKIILTGNACSGKTFTAIMIENAYDNVVWIEARKVNKKNLPFIFDQVSEKTDLIIIDDVTPDKFQLFETLIYIDKIRVETRGKNPFFGKTPDVIITFDGNPDFFKNYGVSFLQRCKIIECSKGGNLFLHKEVKFHNAVNQINN